ncbi:MAG: type II toxin-antitoxin system PemK/MazF family toxin [bacterium]|nr:type II toxin-antitoxin system PemK/MazF family toxin [bacterium]
MVVKSYIPERGDLVWVDFGPVQKGHEQAGRRPSLVISPSLYNGKSGMVLLCPITSQAKGYAFEILLDHTLVKGVILADQIRTFSWKERGIKFIDHCNEGVVVAVQENLLALIQ